MAKKINIDTLLKRIEALETRLDKLDPISKRKLPNKKDQISDIKNNLDEWAQKFPSVDIEFELLKMLDWLQANQKRKKDYKAFFRNWLRKASNSIEKEVQDVYRYIYGCEHTKKTVNIKNLNTRIWLSSVISAIHKKRLLNLYELSPLFRPQE